MFESDDFDQVLSQFEFPEDVTTLKSTKNINESAGEKNIPIHVTNITNTIRAQADKTANECNSKNANIENRPTNTTCNKKKIVEVESPKHFKRKMISSYFDHKSKRKFPGPAGLLTGGLEENRDETICQMELLSQDVDFSQNYSRGDLFQSPLWTRLLDDLKDWNIKNVDSIKVIKQQAISGSLRRRKAHTITAFVEAVDRSVSDPLIIMRDTTGETCFKIVVSKPSY